MNRLKFALVTMPRYSITIFILLLLLSISFYSGGTLNDPSTDGYSMTRNFFSDLGILSKQNIISVILFGLALLLCGLTFIFYFYYFMKLFSVKKLNSKMGKTGAFFGILELSFLLLLALHLTIIFMIYTYFQ